MAIKQRNVYVDFFRGLALWFIFIDHTPGDRLERLTFQRISACDAFEVFVILAGFSVSYAYGPALIRQGVAAASGKILRRSGTIYGAHLLVFGMLYAETGWLRRSATGRTVMDALNLKILGNFALHDTAALLTFNYQAGLIDILPLYIVLLLGLAVAIPLLRFPRLWLLLSFTLYVVTYLFDLHIPGLPIGGDASPVQFFNPLAWQVLLVTGAVLVIEPSLRPDPRLHWDVAAVSIALAGFAIQVLIHLDWHGYDVMPTHTAAWGPILAWMEDSVSVGQAKMHLHPLRLASILAWTWIAYRLAPVYGGWLRRPWARPIILCGQHALPVFCAGVAMAPIGGMWLLTNGGVTSQVVYNGTGLFILVCVATAAAATRPTQKQWSPALAAGLPVRDPAPGAENPDSLRV